MHTTLPCPASFHVRCHHYSTLTAPSPAPIRPSIQFLPFTPLPNLSYTPSPLHAIDKQYNHLPTNKYSVHQLDKTTTGCLFTPQTIAQTRKLAKAFANRRVHKTYWGIVEGAPEQDQGTCSTNVTEEEKEAITKWKVRGREVDGKYALVQFEPVTGRKHQIRIHAATELKCPLVGDTRYGAMNKNRIYLHCKSMAVQDVGTVRAEIPECFLHAIRRFGIKQIDQTTKLQS